MSDPKVHQTTIADDLRQWAATCSPTDARGDLAERAADEIERLLEELMATQRSAFDAGYEAAQAGKWRAGAYLDWSKSA